MPPPSAAPQSARAIAIWLLGLSAMVVAMVILGGVTRLTHSGLSIVEWDVLMGWIPPLSEAEWQVLYERYKQFPEYQKLNLGMALEGFKSIFWLEFIHRVWGRLIGVAFLVPFLVFLIRGQIPRALAPHLVVMFVLGGLQGVLGWYMVKSGLVDRPDVSQYRLAAHLAAAVAIYGYMLWVAMGLLEPRRRDGRAPPQAPVAVVFLVVVCVTVISGAFVAGLDAGLVHNTFPLMDDGFLPGDLIDPEIAPLALNFFEHRPAVQFDHRILAYVTVLCALALWLLLRRDGMTARLRRAGWLVLVVAVAQAGLGVATVLAYVPVSLAAAHQAGALVLFSVALWALHLLRTTVPR